MRKRTVLRKEQKDVGGEKQGRDEHPLTVRITRERERRLSAYSHALNRSYRDLIEAALDDYLGRLKLKPDEQRIVDAHLGR